MYVARQVAYGQYAVEFVEGRDRYRVATFGPIGGVLVPELRAREYAAWCNQQAQSPENMVRRIYEAQAEVIEMVPKVPWVGA